jgi:hypothetical protein
MFTIANLLIDFRPNLFPFTLGDVNKCKPKQIRDSGNIQLEGQNKKLGTFIGR